jgi:hypothetical protein
MPYPKCSKCDKKIKHRKTRCQGGFLEIGRWLVTRAGFLSCTDIQPFEYFVDRFVDLKAKNWVNFTRFYSGKSVFTKVREKPSLLFHLQSHFSHKLRRSFASIILPFLSIMKDFPSRPTIAWPFKNGVASS